MMYRCSLAGLVLALACTALAGCTSKIDIQSNRSADYNGDPKRILLVAKTEGFGNSRVIAAELKKQIDKCGSRTEIYEHSSLELDDSALRLAVEKLGPDSVMAITETRGLRREGPINNNVFKVWYNVQLTEVPTKKTVWRAAIFVEGTHLDAEVVGNVLGREIVNKMKSDRIFISCQA